MVKKVAEIEIYDVTYKGKAYKVEVSSDFQYSDCEFVVRSESKDSVVTEDEENAVIVYLKRNL